MVKVNGGGRLGSVAAFLCGTVVLLRVCLCTDQDVCDSKKERLRQTECVFCITEGKLQPDALSICL